jgi:hypothetical protein
MEEFLNSLELLRKRLNTSGTERTDALGKNMGTNCNYYQKSLNSFLKKDLPEITELLCLCYNLIKDTLPTGGGEDSSLLDE